MIPILYEKDETQFTTNGLGRLTDCTYCRATEERNGIYEVEFQYPVGGIHFEDILIGRVIACTHDDQGDTQPFDIYKKSEPINGLVIFNARHISYRLSEITVEPFTTESCALAIAGLKTHSIGTNPFTFNTDKTTSGTYKVKVPSSCRALLGGNENSLLDVFGTGEYKFDGFSVYLMLHRGDDTDVSIRYGKNLVDFKNDEDYGNTYNAVVPFWYGQSYDEATSTSSDVLVTLPEKFIGSGHTLPSGRIVTVPMDCSSDFQSPPSVNELRTFATNRLTNSDKWLPSQNITVNFVQLWQTEEYKEYAPLQRVRLCDTVLVDVPMYNIAGLRIKVVKVVYNVLLDRYDEMELGSPQTTFAQSIISSGDFSKAVAELNKKIGILQDLIALKRELEAQIDAKIETFAQSTDPSADWSDIIEHDGDLWLYTGMSEITVDGVTIHPQGTYQYDAATGKWLAYSTTSANLFDLADGKTTIFYGSPTEAHTGAQDGDYLVNTDGCTYRLIDSTWMKITDFQEVVDSAVENATDLITGGQGGYVTLVRNANGQPIEIVIADDMDLDRAVNVWRWNQNGIGYSSTGYNGTYKTAWTIDGSFVADFITSGTLNANLIRTGIISDYYADNYWNLNTGNFVTEYGSIGPFEIRSGYLRYKAGDTQVLIDKGGVLTTVRVWEWDGVHATAQSAQLSSGNVDFYGTYNDQTFPSSGLSIANTQNYRIQQTQISGVWELRFDGKSGTARTFMTLYNGSNSYPTQFKTNVKVNGSLAVTGSKPRLVQTKNYSERLLFCYETPTPLFGDIGEAVLDEEGICYVELDDIFTETIAEQVEYQVFLQKEGEGDCWISDKKPRYFAIKGTPGLKVAWELKAKQRDYSNIRLEPGETYLDEYEVIGDPIFNTNQYITEQEELLYG